MPNKKYQPQEIEARWQQKWVEEATYKTDLQKDQKFYCLAEYAYPSGDLHVGHWFTWCGADIYARFKRMQGFNVFFPNGFDSFGLPAEGAAIKRGIHPQDWTEANIKKMKQQFDTLGASFDFYGDLASHKPEYYKWNQWLFLKMFEKGLAYRGQYLANWCPNDQTVLANEAVEAGKCWRCGAEVIQKEVDQWFFKITDYAEGLIWPQSPSVDWPKATREAQNDWIGKSQGALIKFEDIEVYTTRADTIYGATFLVLAPEHPLTKKLITDDQREQVEEYLKLTTKKNELERKENKQKTGVFTGTTVKNPLSEEQIPVWIADYVLPGYGTGAIMAVPAHDERDFEFAKKFDLPIKPVISKDGKEESIDLPYSGEGKLINSNQYDGLSTSEARENITKDIIEHHLGSYKIQYHIHDWSISRQRYWGTPIPIIHCPKCGMVPVSEADLPVKLPYEVDYNPKGKSPLQSNEDFINVECPKCHGAAKRDPDTMDTFVDSSWYFFRYLDPNLDSAPFDQQLAEKIMPVDIYFGGAEHTLGHTLYSRFVTKVFKDLGLTKLDEYALKRVNHGIVLGPDGNKMSKSKGNVVNPDEEVKKFGSDAVRLHVAFFMPYTGVGPWISERIWGPYHFLERVWDLRLKVSEYDTDRDSLIKLNKTVDRVSKDIDEIGFNTAIASEMEWLNFLLKKQNISQIEYKTLLKLLAPFAPHITEELWHMIGEENSIHLQKWPEVDPNYLQDDQINIVLQVNGKVRDNILIDNNIVEKAEQVKELALGNQKVQKFTEGKQIDNIIYIPGKIINVVTQ